MVFKVNPNAWCKTKASPARHRSYRLWRSVSGQGVCYHPGDTGTHRHLDSRPVSARLLIQAQSTAQLLVTPTDAEQRWQGQKWFLPGSAGSTSTGSSPGWQQASLLACPLPCKTSRNATAGRRMTAKMVFLCPKWQSCTWASGTSRDSSKAEGLVQKGAASPAPTTLSAQISCPSLTALNSSDKHHKSQWVKIRGGQGCCRHPRLQHQQGMGQTRSRCRGGQSQMVGREK